MRKSLKIGTKEYKFKKDAIAHYRTILNSYDFGQSLNDSDYNDLIDLLNFNYFNQKLKESVEMETENLRIEDEKVEREEVIFIENIKIAEVQFNTKCFELFYNDGTSFYISYLKLINNKKSTPEELFYIACRNSVHADIRSVKQEYFDLNSKKGLVKCQETGVLSYWEELVIDHRQPNTFSIIVDRFKEVKMINLKEIDYTTSDQNHLIFENENMTNDFKIYHKEKANLRVVRKECNSSRTGMGRLKKTGKDLTIK